MGDLFTPGIDWGRLLALRPGTDKSVILVTLLSARGGYLHGWSTWRGDWRARVSELRRPIARGGLGVPIVDRPSELYKGHSEYALPRWFCDLYWQRRGERRAAG